MGDIEVPAAQYEALVALVNAAQSAVRGHDIIISNGGTGWARHVEEPLWQIRKALHEAGMLDIEFKSAGATRKR
jgi:hypothetical protein